MCINEEWLRACIDGMSSTPTSLQKCAEFHWRDIGISNTLDKFRGDLDALLDFLRREWGWIVTVSDDGAFITADENAPTCVCPLVKHLEPPNPALCDCSAHFDSMMFEYVLGRPVRARIVASILRGAKTCVYGITLLHRLIGKTVTVTVDRPKDSRHPKHPDIIYPVNYGYISGIPAADGDDQDAYILGVDEPVASFTGKVIAVIHRRDDVEDKWVTAPEGLTFTEDEIARAVSFHEQYFESEIIM